MPKGIRRLGGLDDIIISLYAGGMTIRDIEHHCGTTIGTDVSPETISKITDAVLDEVAAWQRRPLEAFYPVIYLDAIQVKVRDGAHVGGKAAHIAVGVDMDGVKHVLGIWVQTHEGAKFWAGVCADLANRGIGDVLIVCCDGLTGLPAAIEATWTQATVQACMVHLIRAAMQFVSYGDFKAVAVGLKPVYTAADADAALVALETFAGSKLGLQYPHCVKDLAGRLGTVHPVPGVLADAAPGHLHHQQHREPELPAAEDHQEPRPLPQRHGGGETVVAGDLQHRGQTLPPAREERGLAAEKRKASGRLVEGQVVTNWKQALAQLAIAYPDRIDPTSDPAKTNQN